MKRIRIIDGDGHVNEDIPEIIKHLPEPYLGMARRSVGSLGLFPPLDHLHTPFRDSPATLQGRGRVGPQEWLAFLEDVGIERTVLYTTAGLSYGRFPYPEVAIAVTRAYNDWLHETYVSKDSRFQGMGLIPMQEPQAAVDELRRTITELGFCGAMLPSNGLKGHLGDREYWPVYEEASRLGCCLGIHGGSHIDFGMDHMDVWPFIHALGHPFGQMIALAGIVSNGILDRYPNVRIGFMEAGVSWLVACLERFDSSSASFSQYDASGRFPAIPAGGKVSEYLKGFIREGRIFVGCEGDELGLAQAVQLVGSEPFIYSSDFPHEVTNETCKEEIEEVMENEGLTESDRENILCPNAERFYNLQPVAVG